MKVLTTTGLTKLIELSKGTFLDKNNVIDVSDALATVALTGSYNDLSNKPVLGSAAYANTSDFATAAEGTLADTALQPGDDVSDLNNDAGYQTAGDVATAISGKANTDMDNLTDTGKNISNWSTNVSNCITEIPQDIKLELNNGTLTLKAGSKVYVPNGPSVFNSITLSADNSITGSGSNVSYLVCCNESGIMTYRPIKNCVSGAGATTTSGFAYNITTNEIYYYNSASVPTIKSSLPICIVSTNSNGVFSTIDQVFNGFGYIGSTIFALPGVKGLMPSGRNADGTLNNTAFTVNNVITRTTSYDFDSQCALIMRDTGIDYVKQDFYLESEITPALKQYVRLYQSTENQMYYGEASGWVKINGFNFGLMTIDSSGKITSFSTKTVFRALDAGGGGGSGYYPDLFDWKWADHEISDMSWLRADTFSWQSGDVYVAAYNHLAEDLNSLVTKEWYGWTGTGWIVGTVVTYYTKSSTPAVGDLVYSFPDSFGPLYMGVVSAYDGSAITVTSAIDPDTYGDLTLTYSGAEQKDFHFEGELFYYLAADGHKICPATQESNVTAIYTATGVAWYYILDTVNTRFKLPRTKFGVTGLRDTVGKYVAPGLPNITGTITQDDCAAGTYNARRSGAFRAINTSSSRGYMFDRLVASNNIGDIGFNAGWSNSIYGASNTVQPPATQQYLYFYVGQFSQSAVEQTAGLNASLFNNKVDIGHQVIAFQEPNAGNNYTWYRKYADGWVEQGGVFTATVNNGNSNNTCNFPITMKDTHYAASVGGGFINNVSFMQWDVVGKTTTYVSIAGDTKTATISGYTTNECSWQVSGMAA